MVQNIYFDTFKKNGFTDEQVSLFQSKWNQKKMEDIELERNWISCVSDMLNILVNEDQNDTTDFSL
jgi:hypothetical protein